MSTPARALPGRGARRGHAGQRPDLMWLLWALAPFELLCGCARSLLGGWAVLPAGAVVVVVLAVISWSIGGRA